MSIITRKLTLVGAHRGKTISLRAGDRVYQFTDGSMEVTGPSGDVDNITKFLNRCYQAFPNPSRELDEAVAAIHGGDNAAEAKQDEAGTGGGTQGDAGGAGQPAPELNNAAKGGGHAETQPRKAEPGRGNHGNGQSPAIAEALRRLDPADDEHWTADGKPKMTALEDILGRSDITRAQVEATAPGFNREKARATIS